MSGPTPAIDIAVDNDVIIKAACYGLTTRFWPQAGLRYQLGVLGAARYVVAKRIARSRLVGHKTAAQHAFAALLATASILEPTDVEVGLATEMEVMAQRAGLSLDAGESQLVAMTIHRAIPVLETGDKRAIRSIELLLDNVGGLEGIAGKVRCLEQIVLGCLAEPDAPDAVARAVCAEPNVDNALSICFRCYSPPPEGHVLDPEAVTSYIASLRAAAPRVLMRSAAR
jgi:hypothetical protein